jgi:hypothetical protein
VGRPMFGRAAAPARVTNRDQAERLGTTHSGARPALSLRRCSMPRRELMIPAEPPKRPIGFVTPEQNKGSPPARKPYAFHPLLSG